MSLEINASKINNVVTFSIDTPAMQKAKKSIQDVANAGSKVKDFNAQNKKFLEDQAKAAAKVRAAAKQTASEEKKKAQAIQRADRAANTLYNTETRLKNMTQLTADEQAGVMHQVGRTVAQYERAEISLGRQNALIRRQMQEAQQLNRLREKGLRTAREEALADKIGNRLTSFGKGALGAVGLAGGVGLAATAAYGKAKDAITTVGDTQGELVNRAKLGNVDINLVRALSGFAQANGIDSGTGTQGQRKILDNAKDIADKTSQSAQSATIDKKTGQLKGGNSAVTTLANQYNISQKQLKDFASDPFKFVSAIVNSGQKAGKSQGEVLTDIEGLGDDLGLYVKAFWNQAQDLRKMARQMGVNGDLLSAEQQEQIQKYHTMNQQFEQISDGNKIAFFTGFMENIDPAVMKQLTDAMRDLNPTFEKLGKAAGGMLSAFMQVAAWVGKHIASSVDNDKKTPLVTPQTRQEMDAKSNSYIDQKYGTQSPTANPGTAITSQMTQPQQADDWAARIRSSIAGLFGTSGAPATANRYTDTFNAMAGYRPQQAPMNITNQIVVPPESFKVDVVPNTGALENIVDAKIDTSLKVFNQAIILGMNSSTSSTGS